VILRLAAAISRTFCGGFQIIVSQIFFIVVVFIFVRFRVASATRCGFESILYQKWLFPFYFDLICWKLENQNC
jgi:hypothetical protein